MFICQLPFGVPTLNEGIGAGNKSCTCKFLVTVQKETVEVLDTTVSSKSLGVLQKQSPLARRTIKK